MKPWKRIIAAVLLSVLLAAAAQADTKKTTSSKLKKEDILGVWYLHDISGQSAVILGVSATMEFKKDGKVIMTAETEEQKESSTGTWRLEKSGSLVISDESGNHLCFLDSYGRLSYGTANFTREPDNLRKMPKTIAAESKEAFFGTWKVAYSYSEQDDVLWPLSRVHNPFVKLDEVRIVISEDKVDLTIPGDEELFTGVYPYELIDGRLAFLKLSDGSYIDLLETGELFMNLYPVSSSMYVLTKEE